MEIRGLIFDLDGVLVDSARYHFEAWRRLAASLGIDFTEEQNEELKGISRADSLKKIVHWGGLQLSDEAFADAMERKNTWYIELIQGMSTDEALPGSRAFLESAKGTYGLALGSASRNARSILQRVELLYFFDALVDGNDTTRSKPDPQVFQMAAERLGQNPEQCVVFEDAVAGVQAAKAAGMRVIGVGAPDLLNEADAVIDGFAGFGPKEMEQRLMAV
jgi:beta-phosphoglucomutase